MSGSVASAAAADGARGAPGALARFEHMIEVGARDGVSIESHDRIGEMLALVRLHPWLDRRARRDRDEQGGRDEHCQEPMNRYAHGRPYWTIRDLMLFMYWFSSPGR